MENNKYELNSDYVHEIMNDPPKFIVVWGNMIVFALIIVSVLLMNLIPFKVKSTIEGTVLSASSLHSTITIRLDPGYQNVTFDQSDKTELKNTAGKTGNQVKIISRNAKNNTLTLKYLGKSGSYSTHEKIKLDIEKEERFLNRMFRQLFGL